MLYINTLKDLTPKTADIESIYIIREIKDRAQTPISEDKLNNHLSQFFVSNENITIMKNSSRLIEETIQNIKNLLTKQDKEYEPVNLQRAINMLEEIFIPLHDNINYFEDISNWQKQAGNEVTTILNTIPILQSNEEKLQLNQKLNEIFEKILRDKEFRFNYNGIISDGLLERIKNLNECMENGFFFYVKIEEHLNKVSFNLIRRRISQKNLNIVDNIAKDITKIKKGVEIAYKHNMHMINLALVLYAYLKIMRK